MANKNNYQDARLDIGLAYEGNYNIIKHSIVLAREFISRQGIDSFVSETIEVDLPGLSLSRLFSDTLERSFSNKHDYYIVASTKSYDPKEENPNQHILRNPKLCHINHNITKEDLEEIINGNRLRSFQIYSGSRHSTEYYYNNTKNPEAKRTVTINLGLCNIKEQEVSEVIEQASKIYESKFGITFDIVGKNDFSLPLSDKSLDSLIDLKYFKNLANFATEPSDIYLLFVKDDRPRKSGVLYTCGRSYISQGACWIRKNYDPDKFLSTLLHEIAHLFNANHVFLKNAIMHPVASKNQFLWDDYNERVIDSSKFRRWILSRQKR